ncbi:MAG: thiamine pyrophosphate-dependent dehydrogenase E1 component subunit alpha [Nitrospinota bacterium]
MESSIVTRSQESLTEEDLAHLDFFQDLADRFVEVIPPHARWRDRAELEDAFDPQTLRDLYYYMLLHRRFEEQVARAFRNGLIPGSAFFGRGHEAVSVGSAYALEPRDILAPLHRNAGAHFVKGHSPARFLANYLGRVDGHTRGRDGNVHVGCPERNILQMISHLGTMVPIAVGAAWAAKYRGEDAVALTYIGDGALNVGDVQEGLTCAAVHRLPFILVVDNNQWAFRTPLESQHACRVQALRAMALGIPGYTIDGTDVLLVYTLCREAVARARRGEGPTLIEAVSFRACGHSIYDKYADYVPAEAIERWATRDPVDRFEQHLLEQRHWSPAQLDEVKTLATAEVEEAYRQALASPLPDPQGVTRDVYAP